MNYGYNRVMGRKLTKPRSRQGEHLVRLREAAGMNQRELAQLIGETPQNIAYWEQAEKPPRGEVLPKMAKALGVRIEDLLSIDEVTPKPAMPAGKLRKVIQEAALLPRKQQDKIAEFVSGFLLQYKQNNNPSAGNPTNQ